MANEVVARDLPSSGLQRIGLRLFTVYGPLGRPDMAVFRLLASSILGKSFHLTANLNVQRDFTYVDDVSKIIEGICKAISLPPIINVAGSNPFSLGELLEILEDQEIVVDVLRGNEDPLDSKVTHGSTETIRQFDLDVPQTHLRDGIQRTWEWMKRVDRRKIQEWYESSL
jgi:UDP-glucuronate 4-epimerase